MLRDEAGPLRSCPVERPEALVPGSYQVLLLLRGSGYLSTGPPPAQIENYYGKYLFSAFRRPETLILGTLRLDAKCNRDGVSMLTVALSNDMDNYYIYYEFRYYCWADSQLV